MVTKLINTYLSLHCSSTEILYPAMRSIARHMGVEDEFEELITVSQCVVSPKEASEVEIKTCQVKQTGVKEYSDKSSEDVF